MLRWPLLLSLVALYGCAVAPAQRPAFPVSMGPQAPNPGPTAPTQALPAPQFLAAPAVGTPTPAPVAPPAAAPDPALVGPDEEPDDGLEEVYGDADAPATAPTSPALTLSDDEFADRFKHDRASLGPMSVGRPSSGLLLNGMQMPKGDHWDLLDPGRAWGTKETVDALTRCIEKVNALFPATTPVVIGHISARDGGRLSPHVSHQAGRDVDVGYYYRPGTPRGFIMANEGNLDLPRTWALVKTALKETDVDMIFMDTSIQRLLVQYAASAGEDDAFLDDAFQVRGKNPRAPVRHAKGHGTHVHFRFHNPVAEKVGIRAARFVTPPPPIRGNPATAVALAGASYVPHKARSGDTLVLLAKRYGTTVEEIERANGLRSIAIRAGVIYKIPQKGKAPGRVTAVAHRQPSKPQGGKR